MTIDRIVFKYYTVFSNPYILSSLNNAGFFQLTEEQLRFMPHLFEKENVVIHCKSGSGKTAGMAMFAVNTVDLTKHQPQVIFVCASAESSMQLKNLLESIGRHADVRSRLVVQGGNGKFLC